MSVTHSPRARAREEFLVAAQRIVDREGEAALTMKRLAVELDCSVGRIYRYFASKDVLAEEVRRRQIARVVEAVQAASEALDPTLASVDAGVAALARVICVGLLLSDTASVLPDEVDLACKVIGEPGLGEPLLVHLTDPLAAAVAACALASGDARARALLVAAIVPLVPLARRSGRVDAAPGGGSQLPYRLLECLLLEWGADPETIVEAGGLVAGQG